MSKMQELLDQCPECQSWVDTLSYAQVAGVKDILDNVGVASFKEHWKEHKADIEQLKHEFGDW